MTNKSMNKWNSNEYLGLKLKSKITIQRDIVQQYRWNITDYFR